MDPKLTSEPSPVSESSLLAGVLALGDSTDNLTRIIAKQTVQRKGLTALAVAAFVSLIIFCIVGGVALQRITNVDNTASDLTSPEAFAQQQANADYRADRTIFCVSNKMENVHNGTPLDERCPKEFPGVPVRIIPPN